ncbi:MAG: UDP-N-acetylmuramoyl-L-alanyl-D-glutamate--2,6-diaminopimelate ligase [Verrucomicrobiota bacterium]
MMKLQELIQGIETRRTEGDLDAEITSIEYDSRKVAQGSLFAALPGSVVDGHRYLTKAIGQGASAVLLEREPTEELPVPWVQVPRTRVVLGQVSSRYYGDPSKDLRMAGITGTNGKTTTAFLLRHLNEAAQRRCGLLGTVVYETGKRTVKASHTTPESSDVHELLAEMRDAACRSAVMEVSSHGLDQHRTGGVDFDVGVFTNLSQDHLDYHGDMESYFQSKRRLFENLRDGSKRATGVVNRDDLYGKRLLEEKMPGVDMIGFGFGGAADFRASKVRTEFGGTTFQLDALGRQFLIRMPLIGHFNVFNVLAALAAAKGMGLNLREAIQHMAEAPQVPGRMESVAENTSYRVFVDYAHTPDAVEKASETLRGLKPNRLITVFGCGGDRDRTKRPLMAQAACKHSDLVVLTSDNPRTEDPKTILEDAKAGLSGRYLVVEDRREAIREAIFSAGDRDVVLIAGKGHEDYQLVGTQTLHFDDREVARGSIAERRENRP